MSSVLTIENLVVEFKQSGWRKPPFRAVDGVSFDIRDGETVGLVGESGSGKSTIGRAILGLARVTSGQVSIDGEDVSARSPAQRRKLAASLSAVFQDPYGSLNPARTVGKSVIEPLAATRAIDVVEQRKIAQGLLTDVHLDGAMARRYPHSLSGGQRQRVAIARGLGIRPKLVICDEAVSALDVVTRAQILNLFVELRDETKAALLFIGHDLPVVAYLSSRVVVLYHGRVMERGDAKRIMRAPLHPYTRALLAAVPVVNPQRQRARREARRAAIRTTTVNASLPPVEGCPFAPRCPHASQVCWTVRPAEVEVDDATLRCHMFDPQSGHPGEAAPGSKSVTELAAEIAR